MGAGIFDEEDDEILVDWSKMMRGLEDKRILAVKCGDFHSVALMEDGQIRTWGAGILGNGNEWYDSRPQNIRFFEATGRSVSR